MPSLAELSDHDERPSGDQVVWLSGSFDDFEAMLRIRGDRSSPRLAYLEGTIEIVTPSQEHEYIKSLIGHLVAAWCFFKRIRFKAVGSWTLKDRSAERAVEPDECYIIGAVDSPRPHLAIEVLWTSRGIDKLEIYRQLGVQEVWVWRRGRIHVHRLAGDRDEERPASEVLPGIDLEQLASFLDRSTTYDAVLEYRAALESGAGGAAPPSR